MSDQLILSAVWVIVFFQFAFVLLFVWSKAYIISRKLSAISQLLRTIRNLACGDQSQT
jgi:hypothetical protein